LNVKTRRRSPTLAADRLPKVTVQRPAPLEVPDWSPATLELLARLTPLERGFVEWYATGASAAEAYRQAAGRDVEEGADASRQLGYKIRVRPRVQAAIDSALKDQNFDARCDRQWMLRKLMVIVDKCEESDKPGAVNALIDAIRLIANLTGLLPYRPPEVAQAEPEVRRQCDVKAMVAEIILRAKGGVKDEATPPPLAIGPVVRVEAHEASSLEAVAPHGEARQGHTLPPTRAGAMTARPDASTLQLPRPDASTSFSTSGSMSYGAGPFMGVK
jgi:hypothetical protein